MSEYTYIDDLDPLYIAERLEYNPITGKLIWKAHADLAAALEHHGAFARFE